MSAAHAAFELVACPDCDLLHQVHPLQPGTAACCARCGALIARKRDDGLERALAWTCASLVLFALAHLFPLLSFRMGGRVQEGTLLSGCLELLRQGHAPLGALVLFTGVVAPGVRLAGLFHVLLPRRRGRQPWQLARIFRLVERLAPWSMLEVFLLGALVALIKLSDLAEVVVGPGLFAFAALMLTSTATATALDPRLVWRRL